MSLLILDFGKTRVIMFNYTSPLNKKKFFLCTSQYFFHSSFCFNTEQYILDHEALISHLFFFYNNNNNMYYILNNYIIENIHYDKSLYDKTILLSSEMLK